MYRILGGDGKQYGPVDADTLRQWIADGRANAQTQVFAEGGTAWVVTSGDDRVWHTGPAGQVVRTEVLPSAPVAVAAGRGTVWVALASPPSVVALDATTLETEHVVELPRPPADLTLTGDRLVVVTGS